MKQDKGERTSCHGAALLVVAAQRRALASPLDPRRRRGAESGPRAPLISGSGCCIIFKHTHTHITICARMYILLCYPYVDTFTHERRERLNRRPFSPAFTGARGLISAWEFHSSLKRRSDGTDRMCSPVRASSSVCSWKKETCSK